MSTLQLDDMTSIVTQQLSRHGCMVKPSPFHYRGGRLQKTVSSALEAGVKRGFLNPDYMRPAWRAELDQVLAVWKFFLLPVVPSKCPSQCQGEDKCTV